MLKLLASAHTVRGRPTIKEVIERFWKGSVHELKENAKEVPKNSKETKQCKRRYWLAHFTNAFERAQVFSHVANVSLLQSTRI